MSGGERAIPCRADGKILRAGDVERLPGAGASLSRAAGQHLLWAFRGPTPTAAVLEAIASGVCAGVVLYRHLNVVSPQQVRDLCAALQRARPAGDPPLIVATDQEGGQLQAIGDGATAWPGNLALGAAGSTDLAHEAGEAIGRELAAMGVNLDFAPVCDLANDPSNPVIGTRSFGDQPQPVGRLAASFVEGLQSAGVAGSAKHFPGHGAAHGDSHTGLPVVERDAAALREIELAPFAAAIAAGVKTVMAGHLAVPSADDGSVRPATTSPNVIRRLLRAERSDGGLGYDGVVVSDALDMGAIQLPGGLPSIAVAAAAAGIDLLTPGPLQAEDPAGLAAATAAIVEGVETGRLDRDEVFASAGRVWALRRWLEERGSAPSLVIVDGAEHRALAAAIARASLTLVRDPGGLLPLPPRPAPVVAIVPRPADLTPADTSSLVQIDLAGAFLRHGRAALGLEVSLDPDGDEVAAVLDAARTHLGDPAEHGRVVVATIDARSQPGQARLVEVLVAAGLPTIAAALRSPRDASILPAAAAVVCGYSIQPPTVEALVASLCGEAPWPGRLPVALERSRP